jgi:hypothetical protein
MKRALTATPQARRLRYGALKTRGIYGSAEGSTGYLAMDARNILLFALRGNLPFVPSTGDDGSVNHAAEISRLMDECAKLRETLGKQIEERAIKIAKHQRALLQEGCTGERRAKRKIRESVPG